MKLFMIGIYCEGCAATVKGTLLSGILLLLMLRMYRSDVQRGSFKCGFAPSVPSLKHKDIKCAKSLYLTRESTTGQSHHNMS